MGQWHAVLNKSAEHDLQKIDQTERKRIIKKIEWLANHFDTTDPLPLVGEFRDFFKLRVGDWRVLYRIGWDAHTLIICQIDKRDKIYKRR